LTTFESAAQLERDNFVFAKVVGNKEINTHYSIHPPNVIIFKQFDERKNVLDGSFDKLIQFIKAHSTPTIDEIGPTNYKQYVDSGLPLAYLFVDEASKTRVIDMVNDIAKATKGKINFVWIDWDKYARHSERVGLSGKVVPAIAIEKPAVNKHWAFDETATITAEAVKKFFDNFLAGSLDETLRSEEIPATQGPVVKIVGKTFDKIVHDETKDVLVEFYAPWCGHCKSLQPTYEQLATDLKSVKSVVIAQIDATANDIDPTLTVRGFPTIKLFPANNKKKCC